MSYRKPTLINPLLKHVAHLTPTAPFVQTSVRGLVSHILEVPPENLPLPKEIPLRPARLFFTPHSEFSRPPTEARVSVSQRELA
eukprot:2030565-Pyramimonas_sp.AAC.3